MLVVVNASIATQCQEEGSKAADDAGGDVHWDRAKLVISDMLWRGEYRPRSRKREEDGVERWRVQQRGVLAFVQDHCAVLPCSGFEGWRAGGTKA